MTDTLSMSMFVSKKEMDKVLHEREVQERRQLNADICKALDLYPEKVNKHIHYYPEHEPFGNISDRLTIETLRGLLAGIRSREQRTTVPRSYFNNGEWDD